MERCGERHFCIVEIESSRRGPASRLLRIIIASFLVFTGKCKLRIEPGEFAIAETRSQRDFATRLFGNLHAKMNRVGRARRNQSHVNHGARRPRVALVDRITMSVHLQ